MKVVAYLKPTCGWSAGVREVLSRYDIDYEEKLISDPDIYAEMVMKTGQPMSPCVEIDGEMLVDVAMKSKTICYDLIMIFVREWVSFNWVRK